MATTIGTLDWGNRNPQDFIQKLITSSDVWRSFTIYDGVKYKKNVPIHTGTIAFHGDLCTFDPQASIAVGEKEMSVAPYKWDFSDCKTSLMESYRSMMLSKGLNNPETMDTTLGEWSFDFFLDSVQEKVLTEAALQVVDKIENGPDAADVTTVTGVTLSDSNILAQMKAMFLAAPEALLDSIEGESNMVTRPVWFMGGAAYRFFQVAIAELNVAYSHVDQDNLPVPTFYGIRVVRFAKLEANVIILAEPSNFVLLTDDLNDVNQINQEYKPLTNTLDVSGQFMLGFDFKDGERIVYTSSRIA